jgi:hypothetical protein
LISVRHIRHPADEQILGMLIYIEVVLSAVSASKESP